MSDLVQLRAPAGAGPAPRPRRASLRHATRLAYVETYGCQMNVADSDLIWRRARRRRLRAAPTSRRRRRHPASTPARCARRPRSACSRAPASSRALKRARPGRRARDRRLHGRAPQGRDRRARARRRRDRRARQLPPAARARRARARGGAAPLVDTQLDRAETYEGLVRRAPAATACRASSRSSAAATSSARSASCRYTRGRERGTPPREVLRQVRALADAGYARCSCSARPSTRTAARTSRSPSCCARSPRVDGIERIRFTSPYPVDFTDDVIAAIAEEPKICKYVHLPVQSGSDAVLERMRRGYTVADFRAIVAALRAAMPGHRALHRHPDRLLRRDRRRSRGRRSRSWTSSASTARSCSRTPSAT